MTAPTGALVPAAEWVSSMTVHVERIPAARAGLERRWRWVAATPAGVAVPVRTPHFTCREEAEDWLAARGEWLARHGASAVVLLDGERVVYGPVRWRTVVGTV
ncbi:hypothetical protein [Nakamurella endophytica]|uniref:Uncharacterized protein n=1 Tax=Nakamurella endophytica TaxID=1748367 RepID=A0A917SJV0_9ACTN|nr:hypothetical protein [Nakamurella endophytica]GGL84886.1 hypothetical protein GCM10011594_00590 [Nakamurella endophytica]